MRSPAEVELSDDFTSSATVRSGSSVFPSSSPASCSPIHSPLSGSPTGSSIPYEAESTCDESSRFLGDDMEVHAADTRLNDKEAADRHMLRTVLSGIIADFYPKASVHCYGSFAYGLSTSSSPLDLVVEGCVGLETTFHSVLKPLRKLLSVRRIMQESKEAMLRATCPVTGISVNLSLFSNERRSLPRRTASSLRKYMAEYPALRTVVSLVRSVLKLEGLLSLSTFHLILLALPVCAMSSSSDPGVVLVDFLDFYGQNFQFNSFAVEGLSFVERDGTEEYADDSLVLRDERTQNNFASCVSAFDLNRFRIALRRRLNMLNDHVTSKCCRDSAFEAMMWSDCDESPAGYIAQSC